MMRASGLGLGGGLDNAIVIDDYRVLNSDGLRYDDEFVKHKILDAMGDLYLVGQPLLAAYSAFRSGHALNNKLLRELLAAAPAPTRSSPSTTRSTRPPASRSWRAPGNRPSGMLLFRWAILLLLLAPAVSFRASTPAPAQPRFKRFGLVDPQVDADRGVRILRGADPRAAGVARVAARSGVEQRPSTPHAVACTVPPRRRLYIPLVLRAVAARPAPAAPSPRPRGRA